MSVGAAQLGLYRIDVAFVIHIDEVTGRVPLWRTNVEGTENLQGPAIQDVDVRGPRDI